MLTCITCKQKIDDDGGEEGPRGTPNTKESVKSLTTQVLILHLPLLYFFHLIFGISPFSKKLYYLYIIDVQPSSFNSGVCFLKF